MTQDYISRLEAELVGHRNVLKGEALRLTAGDVMVITLAQPHLQFGEQWDHYRKGLQSTLPPGVNCIIISEGVSMSVLTDEQLAAAGLVRRTDQNWSDAGSPPPTPEDYRDLQAKFDQLQTELFNERQHSKNLIQSAKKRDDRITELERDEPNCSDVEALRKAMTNAGIAAPESMEELGWMWMSYVRSLIRSVANWKFISVPEHQAVVDKVKSLERELATKESEVLDREADLILAAPDDSGVNWAKSVRDTHSRIGTMMKAHAALARAKAGS